jgi:hypothetical protein
VAITPKRGGGSNLAFMMNIVKYNSIQVEKIKELLVVVGIKEEIAHQFDMQLNFFLRNSNNMQGLQVTYNMTFVKNIERKVVLVYILRYSF